jgi:hypothetical protein
MIVDDVAAPTLRSGAAVDESAEKNVTNALN